MGKTKIGWCDQSLNFYTWNCNKVSEGCKNCYAEALAKRYGRLPFSGAPQWRESAMKEYRALKAGEVVFVNDMSDTFHEGATPTMIGNLFSLMRQRPDVTFLLLTKRIERAYKLTTNFETGAPVTRYPNVWIGTSIENQRRSGRLDVLKQISGFKRFLSIEPLLEDLGDVSFMGIDQVIVGGESGAARRPFDKAWAVRIRDQCQRDGVPFYFKQGGDFKPGLDRVLDGRTWDELAWNAKHDEEQTQARLF